MEGCESKVLEMDLAFFENQHSTKPRRDRPPRRQIRVGEHTADMKLATRSEITEYVQTQTWLMTELTWQGSLVRLLTAGTNETGVKKAKTRDDLPPLKNIDFSKISWIELRS
jgi:hypothetical protein